MKKLQQWSLSTPIFRRSPSKEETPMRWIEEGQQRVSSGSYDVEAAQKEYDLVGSVSQNNVAISSSDSEEDQAELYVDVEHKVEVSKTLTDSNNKYEYDVPKISFSFFEGEAQKQHKCEVQITLSPPHPKDPPPPPPIKEELVQIKEEQVQIAKCGSDPNISHTADEDDGYYKVPKSIKPSRLSKSLHDFNHDEVNLTLTPSEEIEHISCSQVIVEEPEEEEEQPRSKLRKSLDTLKLRFNKILEDHATQQRVGAFTDKVVSIDHVYRSSKDRCRRMLKSTGKIFKLKKDSGQGSCGDSSSRIVKNDAFFDKVELKASDIEYVFDQTKNEGGKAEEASEVRSLRNGVRRSRMLEGQNGFDDLRRYVKQGGDFCKELAAILQERSEAEMQYSKSLLKLSAKLSRACREGVGGLNEAWKVVAVELEARAEAHRHVGTALLEETAKPLKTLTENQHRSRKHAEAVVDKAARALGDWRAVEAKSKKHSHSCARDNEKLQDAMLDSRLSRTTSLIQLPNMHKNNPDRDTAKLEGKKRKAEDAVKKADIEYYSHCVRSERARLEWESAVLKSAATFQTLEEERLTNLKSVLSCYLNHNSSLAPKLTEATDKIRQPIENAEAAKDLSTFVSLRQSSQQVSEQLLPDFYCEHITLAMNRERRKQALVKLLQLIKQDIERERKSKDGLENLSKAIKQTPNFGSEDSQQTVTEKLYHMKSMLTYLEGARYKVQSALAELDCRPRTGHPLASHITVTRDKAGLQQSILKVPQWLREQWIETDKSLLSEKREEANSDEETAWIDRGTADGNSNQPDSDFDEFSSRGSSICGGICVAAEDTAVQPISQCKALYAYVPNLPDELAIRPGDVVSVYRQQEDGWWLGECNGAVGIFPATYVETMT